MGGEKHPCVGFASLLNVSPPHGRGKAWKPGEKRPDSGITPAWAGKSTPSLPHAHTCEDHPRMGGEKQCGLPTACRRTGSPPHGRGKAVVPVCASRLSGITPAWAGKSRKQQRKNRWKQDHPRMGGEKISTHCSQWSSVGSPPHGRGKASLCWFCFSVECITPAWAGKSMEAGREAP